jgi:hypothetical protein
MSPYLLSYAFACCPLASKCGIAFVLRYKKVHLFKAAVRLRAEGKLFDIKLITLLDLAMINKVHQVQ